MKNYKLRVTVLIILFAISGFSCKKLDENPASFVTPDNFYNSPGQVEAVFASSMNSLWTTWAVYGYGMGTFANDDQLNGGNLIIPQDWGSDLWQAHYNAIMNLNTAIGAIGKGSLKGESKSTIDLLVAQAKFLRAYNYFMLVRMFGDLPLLTEDTPPLAGDLTRSPVADVYKLIISDFTDAIANLPATWPASEIGRPTSDAAKGLLAKAYLTMATYPMNAPDNYQKAADLAGQVISDGLYSLEPDVKKVFSVSTKYGPEMMWSFNSNYADMATDPHIWTDMDGWGDESADPIWTQKYPDQPRKYAYVQIYNSEGIDYINSGNLPGIKKYLYDTKEDFDAGRSIVNIPIIRYADVLLTFAEADNMAHGGPTQAAVDAINKVIDRANGHAVNANDPLATTGMSKEDFDTKVIQERNWELCFEYDRWFDLIRKHILKQESNPTIQQNFTEDDYLFPIPSVDVRLNPKLVQNPGY